MEEMPHAVVAEKKREKEIDSTYVIAPARV
jgi:hypothetical protein